MPIVKKIWKDTFNVESEQLLEFTKDDVDEIIDLIIKDKIDFETFLVNFKAIIQLDNPAHYFLMESRVRSRPDSLPSYSILNPPKTKRGLSFWSKFNRPSAIPLWFIIVYPDVMAWLVEQQKKYYYNDDDEIGEMALFGIERIKKGEENKYFDINGKTRLKYLKNLIQSYKDATKKELETTVKKIENDIYLGEEFLETIGSESNFTFIAENTTKYYLELLRNYKKRFNNEISLFVAAGILDAQHYIFIEKKIDPVEIFDLAKESTSTEEDSFLEFIINLEVKLFEIDTPSIDVYDIRNTCEKQRVNIKKAIEKTKREYAGEPRFNLDVVAFMESKQFESIRRIIGI